MTAIAPKVPLWEDEPASEHLSNAVSTLMYDQTPEGIQAAICRIERAMALLTLEQREGQRARRGLDLITQPDDWKICWACYCEWSVGQYGVRCPCCGKAQ